MFSVSKARYPLPPQVPIGYDIKSYREAYRRRDRLLWNFHKPVLANRPVAVGVVNDVIVSEPPYWWTAEYGVYGDLV